MLNKIRISKIQKRVSLRYPFFVAWLFLICVFCSCGRNGRSGAASSAADADSVAVLHYAKGFELAYFKDYVRVTVFQPGKEGESADGQRCYLYARGFEKVDELPSDGPRVAVPVEKAALASCPLVAFCDRLGVLPQICAVSNVGEIYQEDVCRALAEGKMADIGDAFHLNVEKVLSSGAEVLFVSGTGQSDAQTEFLQKAGLPLVTTYEWKESDVLGRAEWIRLVGAFFACEKQADSLFLEVAGRYESLCEQVRKRPSGQDPTVLPGEDFRGTWYLSGGKSYMASLFRDAGARYRYADDPHTGSISSSLEKVLLEMHDADIWLGVTATSLDELIKRDARYELFDAYRNGKVYHYGRRSRPGGGNDFWESAVVRPDWLLADLVALFHPECLSSHEWIYIEPLQ